MPDRNFDFEGFIDDENRFEESDDMSSFEDQLSVEGLLRIKFGPVRGKAIYSTLSRLAQKAAAENGGEPGLIFTEDGGHFVSFHQRMEGLGD